MAKSIWEIPGAIDELKKLRAEGLSASRIADAMAFKFNHFVSRSAVCGKADRLDLGLSSKETQRFAARQMASRKRNKAKAEREASSPPKPSTPLRRALEMAPEPMPVTEPELVVDPKSRVGIEGLSKHQCRWPIGDPQEPDFHFCDQKQIGGISYCEFHARRAFQTPPTKSPRPFILYRPGVRLKEDA